MFTLSLPGGFSPEGVTSFKKKGVERSFIVVLVFDAHKKVFHIVRSTAQISLRKGEKKCVILPASKTGLIKLNVKQLRERPLKKLVLGDIGSELHNIPSPVPNYFPWLC